MSKESGLKTGIRILLHLDSDWQRQDVVVTVFKGSFRSVPALFLVAGEKGSFSFALSVENRNRDPWGC